MKKEDWKYFRTLVSDFGLTEQVILSGETNANMDYQVAHKIFSKHLNDKMDAYAESKKARD